MTRDGERPDAPDAAMRGTKRVPWLALAPLLAFLFLAALFGWQLAMGPPANELRSALLNRPAPAVALPALPGVAAPGGGSVSAPALPDPEGRVSLVNVFASWCAPCRAEHPAITALAARSDTNAIGIAYKDDPEASARFLAELGNPYERIGIDRDGRTGIDWGITGVPETFVVAPDGTVVHAHAGPVDAEAMAEIEAAIAAAR